MALELIKRQSASFKPERFKDEYEAAAKELVQAQLHIRRILKRGT
jgi:non-homologous end joining protein Ku